MPYLTTVLSRADRASLWNVMMTDVGGRESLEAFQFLALHSRPRVSGTFRFEASPSLAFWLNCNREITTWHAFNLQLVRIKKRARCVVVLILKSSFVHSKSECSILCTYLVLGISVFPFSDTPVSLDVGRLVKIFPPHVVTLSVGGGVWRPVMDDSSVCPSDIVVDAGGSDSPSSPVVPVARHLLADSPNSWSSVARPGPGRLVFQS